MREKICEAALCVLIGASTGLMACGDPPVAGSYFAEGTKVTPSFPNVVTPSLDEIAIQPFTLVYNADNSVTITMTNPNPLTEITYKYKDADGNEHTGGPVSFPPGGYQSKKISIPPGCTWVSVTITVGAVSKTIEPGDLNAPNR